MKSLSELKEIRDKMRSNTNIHDFDTDKTRVLVGMATCGIASGARPVLQALLEGVETRNLEDVSVIQTGCIGLCQFEPIVEVCEPGKDKVTYVKVNADKVADIIDRHLVRGDIVDEYLLGADRM